MTLILVTTRLEVAFLENFIHSCRNSARGHSPLDINSNMSTIHTSLENLLDNHLTLSAPQITQGSKSHTYIRELLANKSTQDSTFPRLIDGDFLSGSYARGTKIYPLDDIDVMMVIDGTGLFAIREGQILNAEVRGSRKPDNPVIQHLGWNQWLSSRTVVELFHGALQQSHPNSTIKDSGQAVNVTLSNGMGIDIVPSFHIVPSDGSQDFYYIPMGRESDGWLVTNPKLDAEIAKNFDEKFNGMFTGVVRLIKHWNQHFNAGLLQSYHLETMAWYAFANYQGIIERYDQALLHLFRNVQQLLVNPCPDATRLGGPIDSYLDYPDRQRSIGKVSDTIRVLMGSNLLGIGTEVQRLRSWRHVMGPEVKFIL